MSSPKYSRNGRQRIDARPKNIIYDSTGTRRLGIRNSNGTVTPITSELGQRSGAFFQSRAERVRQAKKEGSFDQKRATFNEGNRDREMDENGNVVAKRPPTPPNQEGGGLPPAAAGLDSPAPNGGTAAPVVKGNAKAGPPAMVSVPGPMGTRKLVPNPAAQPAKPPRPVVADQPRRQEGRIQDETGDRTLEMMQRVAVSKGVLPKEALPLAVASVAPTAPGGAAGPKAPGVAGPPAAAGGDPIGAMKPGGVAAGVGGKGLVGARGQPGAAPGSRITAAAPQATAGGRYQGTSAVPVKAAAAAGMPAPLGGGATATAKPPGALAGAPKPLMTPAMSVPKPMPKAAASPAPVPAATPVMTPAASAPKPPPQQQQTSSPTVTKKPQSGLAV